MARAASVHVWGYGSWAFYVAIAFAQSVATAMEQAGVKMQLASLEDASRELRVRGDLDPAEFIFVTAPE